MVVMGGHEGVKWGLEFTFKNYLKKDVRLR